MMTYVRKFSHLGNLPPKVSENKYIVVSTRTATLPHSMLPVSKNDYHIPLKKERYSMFKQ